MSLRVTRNSRRAGTEPPPPQSAGSPTVKSGDVREPVVVVSPPNSSKTAAATATAVAGKASKQAANSSKPGVTTSRVLPLRALALSSLHSFSVFKYVYCIIATGFETFLYNFWTFFFPPVLAFLLQQTLAIPPLFVAILTSAGCRWIWITLMSSGHPTHIEQALIIHVASRSHKSSTPDKVAPLTKTISSICGAVLGALAFGFCWEALINSSPIDHPIYRRYIRHDRLVALAGKPAVPRLLTEDVSVYPSVTNSVLLFWLSKGVQRMRDFQQWPLLETRDSLTLELVFQALMAVFCVSFFHFLGMAIYAKAKGRISGLLEFRLLASAGIASFCRILLPEIGAPTLNSGVALIAFVRHGLDWPTLLVFGITDIVACVLALQAVFAPKAVAAPVAAIVSSSSRTGGGGVMTRKMAAAKKLL